MLAQQRQAELDYRDAVARAFREVRDALEAQAEAAASLTLARQRADALRQAKAGPQPDLSGGFKYLKLERMAYYVHKDTYRNAVRQRNIAQQKLKESRRKS